MKTKAFTLIELLGVIVILAIISLVAVPIVINIISEADKNAFKNTAYGVLRSAKLYIARQQLNSEGILEGVTIALPDDRLKLKGDTPEGSVTITKDGKIALAIYNNRYCVTKELDDDSITITENYKSCELPVIIHELNYYKDISQALYVINNSLYFDESLMTTHKQANVGVYIDKNNIPNLVIVKDHSLDKTIELSSDIILNLNGKSLTVNKDKAINVISGNVIIDGTIGGSKIFVSNDIQKTVVAHVNNGSLTLNGGTYESNSNGIGTDSNPNASIIIGGKGKLTMDNAKIILNDKINGTLVGVLVEKGGTALVSNSNIELTSLNGLKSDCVRNYGTMKLINTHISAYSNYTANASKTDYATSTRGINNEGTMTLKDCYVYGSHSGIRSLGTLYINGGTYEGYGHGGIYFAGGNTTSYVKNAKVRLTNIKVGYDDGVAGTNESGMYIGGANNIIVYMDSCELYGLYYPAVLRSKGNESNNALYISNSTAKDFSKYFRNDGSTNKIYIGVGNNFSLSDTYIESGTIVTDVDYSEQFIEY